MKSLAPIEIFGSKINALLSRAAARDLFDVNNMIKLGLFDESEETLLRKCVVFYAAISAKTINKTFNTNAIDSISKYKIKTDLLPVIRKRDGFENNKFKLVTDMIGILCYNSLMKKQIENSGSKVLGIVLNKV